MNEGKFLLSSRKAFWKALRSLYVLRDCLIKKIVNCASGLIEFIMETNHKWWIRAQTKQTSVPGVPHLSEWLVSPQSWRPQTSWWTHSPLQRSSDSCKRIHRDLVTGGTILQPQWLWYEHRWHTLTVKTRTAQYIENLFPLRDVRIVENCFSCYKLTWQKKALAICH